MRNLASECSVSNAHEPIQLSILPSGSHVWAQPLQRWPFRHNQGVSENTSAKSKRHQLFLLVTAFLVVKIEGHMCGTFQWSLRLEKCKLDHKEGEDHSVFPLQISCADVGNYH